MQNIRYTFFILFLLLSGIYWFESTGELDKYAFELTSESCACKTNDPKLRKEKLIEWEQEQLLVYAVFLIPAVIIGLLKSSKWAKILLISCSCVGTGMLLFYSYLVATGRWGW